MIRWRTRGSLSRPVPGSDLGGTKRGAENWLARLFCVRMLTEKGQRIGLLLRPPGASLPVGCRLLAFPWHGKADRQVDRAVAIMPGNVQHRPAIRGQRGHTGVPRRNPGWPLCPSLFCSRRLVGGKRRRKAACCRRGGWGSLAYNRAKPDWYRRILPDHCGGGSAVPESTSPEQRCRSLALMQSRFRSASLRLCSAAVLMKSGENTACGPGPRWISPRPP